MKTYTSIFLLLMFLKSLSLFSQTKNYHTQKIPDENNIHINGIDDENEWKNVSSGADFIQFLPENGNNPSRKTEFKALYDNKNLYFFIKAFDNSDSIDSRMGRRDSWDGDAVVVHLDSYNDKRTGFVFGVNASGVKNDGINSNDNADSYDETWNPIWEVKTKITDYGWNAEIRIPLSQLRFSSTPKQEWGMQIVRYILRNEEYSLWKHVDTKAPGWVSQFGRLSGIENIKPQRQIDVVPYIMTGVKNYEKEEGNPFADGIDYKYNAGLDGKVGITNDFIVDFAINPDFGQVEADPSEVNLTAFETYFGEKRPFFTEGRSITDFQLTPGEFPWAKDNIFYSRRIGKNPSYYPELSDGENIDMPQHVKILGAVKLTGKTKKGLSVGVLESFTNKEKAIIDFKGNRKEVTVEPYVNYFIAGVRKEFNKGNTILGIVTSSTNRFLDEEQFNFLNKNAITGGIDFMQYFKKKKYYLSFKLAGSHIEGSETAIIEQQLSSRRYYQRPGADYFKLDSTRTSLQGQGGTLLFERLGGAGLRYSFNLTWRSPGFELNDVGYIRRANTIFHYFWIGYRIDKPFSVFRDIKINANEWSGWDFGGINLFFGGNINLNFTFKNLWSFSASYTQEGDNMDNFGLRGGPTLRVPGQRSYNLNLNSNTNKKFHTGLGIWDGYSNDNSGRSYMTWANFSFRPLNSLSIGIYPNYNQWNTKLQYVTTEEQGAENQYVFADIMQKTIRLTLRIDYSILPDLTLQYYGSPFISSGLYSDYKKITDSDAEVFENRFELLNSNISFLSTDNLYKITQAGYSDYYFDNPDFRYMQFLSNMVLRWEYAPGSLIYVVWSQAATDFESNSNFNFTENFKQLFSINATDVFLIKISYRFGN